MSAWTRGETPPGPQARKRLGLPGSGPSVRQRRKAWGPASCAAKPSRRSAHLLHRPQWRPSTGAIQENVCSRARSRPNSRTSAFVISDNGVSTDNGCSRPRSTMPPKRAKKSALLSAKGFPLSVPRAMVPTPLSTHQTLALDKRSRLRPGRKTAASDVVSSGTSVPETLQWAPYTSAIGSPSATSGRVSRSAGQASRNLPEVRLLGRLPREPEPHVDRVHDPAVSGLVGNEHRAVDTAADQDRQLPRLAHDWPRYTHPDVQVSRTTT